MQEGWVVNSDSEEYLAERLCQRQWLGVLRALATEFNEHSSAQDLDEIFYRVGVRFSQANPLPEGETVADLERHMNLAWALMEWGTVALSSQDDYLLIDHQFSPLAAAFGEDGMVWAGSFLRGVYRQWLEDAGAGEELALEEVAPLDDWGNVSFRLGV